VKNKLEIVPVRWIDKVLEIALERQPEPLTETAPVEAVAPPRQTDGQGGRGKALTVLCAKKRALYSARFLFLLIFLLCSLDTIVGWLV
jgi:predicted ATP-dependent protease